ncbi:hypothetical protein BRD19_03295 [Halobacteriales archaeon SW_7_65_23]|nr:MAG: hypothetical protein BRD19_03295 [Halobacteriales archaeon SW_7_65_23]
MTAGDSALFNALEETLFAALDRRQPGDRRAGAPGRGGDAPGQLPVAVDHGFTPMQVGDIPFRCNRRCDARSGESIYTVAPTTLGMFEPIRVLHVDNDPEFADLTAEFLRRENEAFSVITVREPEAARATLAEEPIDCVVSDYEMTPVDGIEFLEAVREEHPDLPFIL